MNDVRFSDDLRAIEQDNTRKLVGRAIVYNSISHDLGGFREVIEPGSVTEALMKNDIVALADHKTDKVLGRKSAGTLRLFDSSDGLNVEITIPDTSYGRDVWTAVQRKDKQGMSFNCSVPKGFDVWETDKTGSVIRKVKKVDLQEVSVTGFPAYGATVVEARSISDNFSNADFNRVMLKVSRHLPLDTSDLDIVEEVYRNVRLHSKTHMELLRKFQQLVDRSL